MICLAYARAHPGAIECTHLPTGELTIDYPDTRIVYDANGIESVLPIDTESMEGAARICNEPDCWFDGEHRHGPDCTSNCPCERGPN